MWIGAVGGLIFLAIGVGVLFYMHTTLLADKQDVPPIAYLFYYAAIIILGATDSRAPQGFAPLTIGLAVALINWAGIPVTNLSLNPARSTGTAIFADGWALQQLWLFWVAPILGGAIAGLVYPLIAGQPPSPAKR